MRLRLVRFYRMQSSHAKWRGVQSTVYADTDCVPRPSHSSSLVPISAPTSLKLEQSRVETFQTNSRLVHASGRGNNA
jgi:hypothetical protein